jgi:hypothetical protein
MTIFLKDDLWLPFLTLTAISIERKLRDYCTEKFAQGWKGNVDVNTLQWRYRTVTIYNCGVAKLFLICNYIEYKKKWPWFRPFECPDFLSGCNENTITNETSIQLDIVGINIKRFSIEDNDFWFQIWC